MKNRLLFNRRTSGCDLTVGTGHHCPVTGWWEPGGDAARRRFISEGSLMPALNGSSVSWTYSP